MADFTGMSRTNAFRVKDREAFLEAISNFDLEIQWDKEDRCTLITNSDYGMWPNYYVDENDSDEEFDWAAEMPQYLADGETMVIMEAGHERARYVSGWAVAIHSSGQHIGISLNDIYRVAAASFNVPIESIDHF